MSDRGDHFIHYRDPSERFFVFDMFGTLVVNTIGSVEPIFETLCTYYPGISPSEVSRTYHEFANAFKESHSNMELPITDVVKHLDDTFGFNNDAIAMEKPLLRDTKIYGEAPGARGLLQYLRDKGYKIGVLSNSRYHSFCIRGMLEDVGLSEYVDEVLSSADTGYRKPHKESYEAILRKLGTEPRRCFFAGDNIAKDYYGPQAVHFRGAFLIDSEEKYNVRGSVKSIDGIIDLFEQ